MKKIASIALVLSLFLGNRTIAFAENSSHESSRKIVVFREGTDDATREKIMHGHGIILKNIEGGESKSAELTERDTHDISRDPHVLRIDDDIIMEAVDVKNSARTIPLVSALATQTIPWGITQITAPSAWEFSTGLGIKVAVIDTGIDLTHPDLKLHIKGGFNTISRKQSYTDDNGHGTHVAGIIGALNNTVGVVGVAPDASLYAIKSLDRNGSGYLSDVIEGIDWAIANKMQVINMSLGSSAGNQSLADAIVRAHTAGIVIVAASGNNAGAVLYPAAYSEVIAVGATDNTNTLAYFSNFGPELGVTAPGLNIYSTYKGGMYATLSGTSMATPHVAGLVALVLARPIPSLYDTNADAKWQPSEILHKIQDSSTDLGVVGRDNYFGTGLINALSSVQ